MMTMIYNKKTGEGRNVDAVDAREILRSEPDLYTTQPSEVKAKAPEVDITQPDLSPKHSDSGLPAGEEFTRRLTEDDQALLRNKQRLEGAAPRSQGLSTQQMKDQLDAMGVDHRSAKTKQELAALLDAA